MGRCCGGLVARRLPPGLLLWLAWLVSQLASWLELARLVTELEHQLSSQENSNEPSRATNERVRASYRATSFLSSPAHGSYGPTIVMGLHILNIYNSYVGLALRADKMMVVMTKYVA